MSSSSSRQTIEVITTEEAPLKWSVALREEVFKRFLLGQGTSNTTTLKKRVFGEGSIFSPLLFGSKFFDPSDAFPLWEFESEVLLAALRSSGKTTVDWYQTDEAYVLRAQLPAGKSHSLFSFPLFLCFSVLFLEEIVFATSGGSGKNSSAVKVCVENGKVVEVSGQWKPLKDDQSSSKAKPGDWRSEDWWEYGYVRRLELPEDAVADSKQMEANLITSCTTGNETTLLLELRIPRKCSSFSDCNSDLPIP
ncbi:unnamed protein product [Linum tenue]|uniref:Uncharacterized protein n=1 Tax=Linum tenue TaxID=586396 RepID=A0AAV0H619_9ROSI|nr:unnamed protein product [Linum tenue]